MFLLDTDIVSTTAPTKAKRDPILAEWLLANSDRLYLSVISASEIVAGIVKAQRTGATLKALRIQEWWTNVEMHYGQRLLAYDLSAAHAAGRLADRVRAFNPGYQDIAIAAIAEVNMLTVVTLNERHFAPMGIAYINPLKLPLR